MIIAPTDSTDSLLPKVTDGSIVWNLLIVLVLLLELLFAATVLVAAAAIPLFN